MLSIFERVLMQGHILAGAVTSALPHQDLIPSEGSRWRLPTTRRCTSELLEEPIYQSSVTKIYLSHALNISCHPNFPNSPKCTFFSRLIACLLQHRGVRLDSCSADHEALPCEVGTQARDVNQKTAHGRPPTFPICDLACSISSLKLGFI